VYILYRVLLYNHSLPEWDILILGGHITVFVWGRFYLQALFLYSNFHVNYIYIIDILI
jgi:hypothetical protein